MCDLCSQRWLMLCDFWTIYNNNLKRQRCGCRMHFFSSSHRTRLHVFMTRQWRYCPWNDGRPLECQWIMSDIFCGSFQCDCIGVQKFHLGRTGPQPIYRNYVTTLHVALTILRRRAHHEAGELWVVMCVAALAMRKKRICTGKTRSRSGRKVLYQCRRKLTSRSDSQWIMSSN